MACPKLDGLDVQLDNLLSLRGPESTANLNFGAHSELVRRVH